MWCRSGVSGSVVVASFLSPNLRKLKMAGRKQRGRSWPRGYRGSGRGIDRGRGSNNSAGGRGRGRGRGGQGHVVTSDNVDDFTIRTFHPSNRRDDGRERGGKLASLDDTNNHSGYQSPVRGTTIYRGNNFRYSTGWLDGHVDSSSSRERARIRHLDSKLRRGEASLSQLLYEDRPLRKPIVFVQSKFTPTLFLNQEDIFKPVAEAAGQGEGSVPTAGRIFRTFHLGDEQPNSHESPSDVEELLEIDFEDLGKVMKEVEGVAATSKKVALTSVYKAENKAAIATVGERFTGVCLDNKPSVVRDSPPLASHVERPEARILGEDMDEDDDEIIVYVAPHPRNGKLAPNLNHPSSAAVITPPPQADRGPAATYPHRETGVPPHKRNTPSPAELIPEPSLALSHSPSTSTLMFGDVSSPVSGSPGTSRRGRYPPRTSRRRMRQRTTFGLFGAMHAEAALHELDPLRDGFDPDLDRGGSTSDESAEDGGMVVDRDVDVCAMQAFVNTMSTAGMAHVSADDLEDEARIRAEEEEEEKSNVKSGAESDGSSIEDDTESELPGDAHVLKPAGEGELGLGDSPFADEDESTSDEGETPKELFQMRLERLRKRTEGRPIRDVLQDELDQAFEVDEDSEDSVFAEGFFHNDEILRARDRILPYVCSRVLCAGRNKNTSIPEELYDQWERDRAKKAERKRLRDLERMAAALDPFMTRKGGKKARKARLAAALAAPVTLETVVGYMRRFVADIGGARTLPLPPMGREMRKSVHELAEAFKLKSKSQGKGVGRFTSLIKTTFSGITVNEEKVTRILGRSSSPPFHATHRGERGKGRAGRARPRDGEVVGEAAPKLNGSNIGFRMLSAMGWEEGHQIGVVGGLEAPLVAVIKTTKLGLGASTHSRG
ncbi:hypothetical protein BC827DRAFT_1226041 [Russula dissimulans]|nr:hypothetical protein BC827DRAFT_1226041 [Russula dissimulans]